MQVQPINNYSTNFRGIYLFCSKKNFSDNQKQVADDIMKDLQIADNKDKKNRTYEQRLKEDKDLDFIIRPDGSAVSLTAVKGLKWHENGVETFYTYNPKKEKIIGRYDEKHPFDISDIKPDKKTKDLWDTFATFATYIGLPLIAIISLLTTSKTPIKNVKQSVEQIDSLINRTNPVTKDSTKVLKMIIK